MDDLPKYPPFMYFSCRDSMVNETRLWQFADDEEKINLLILAGRVLQKEKQNYKPKRRY